MVAAGDGKVGLATAVSRRPAGTFVGRGSELTGLCERLETHRFVTLVGAAGAGKTRLAQELTERWVGDRHVVGLAPLRDPALVWPQLTSVLEVATSSARSYADAVIDRLERAASLVVLDNAEHLIDEVAGVAEVLVDRCQHVRVLVTSREPLRAGGEVVWQLDPLQVAPQDSPAETLAASEAVVLFADRASAQDPGFDLERVGLATVAELCRRLDGLPLAIELAAGRVRALTPAQMLERLDDRFRLLTNGPRTADPRHQTLRSAIEWSHALLDGAERRLLRRLSVFAAGFELGAAEEVCSDPELPPGEVAAVFAGLVDRSLVARISLDPPRYELLETIRTFAAGQLDAAGEGGATRDAHARWCALVAAEVASGLARGDDRTALAVFDRTYEDLRAALIRHLEVEDGVGALSLATSLGMAWWMTGRDREGIRWLRACLDAAGDEAPTPLLVAAYYHLGVLWSQDTLDWAASARILDRGIELAASDEEVRWSLMYAYLVTMRATCAAHLEDDATALRWLDVAEPIVTALGDVYGRSFAAYARALVLRHQGDRPGARRALEGLLRCQEEHGHRGVVLLIGCAALGELLEADGEHQAARERYLEALAIRDELGERSAGRERAARILVALARVCLRDGDDARARTAVDEATVLAERSGADELLDAARAVGAQLARAVEPVTEAALHRDGAVWRLSFGDEEGHLPDLKGLAHLRMLVERPGVEVSAVELAAAVDGHPREVGDAGPLLDDRAIAQYRQRISDLDGELQDAWSEADVDRAASLREERDLLLAELARAVGLSGRARRAGSAPERARVNVTRTVRAAIERIATCCPRLAAHLDRSVRTGTLCSYVPDVQVRWRS